MRMKPNSNRVFELQQNQLGLQIDKVRMQQRNFSLLIEIKELNAVSYLRLY